MSALGPASEHASHPTVDPAPPRKPVPDQWSSAAALHVHRFAKSGVTDDIDDILIVYEVSQGLKRLPEWAPRPPNTAGARSSMLSTRTALAKLSQDHGTTGCDARGVVLLHHTPT